MSSLSFQSVRPDVLERDDYECRFCGVTNEQHKEDCGSSLEVHHLIPRRVEEINEKDNLITVCKSCHRTLEYTQGDLIERVYESASTSDKVEELEDKIDSLESELEQVKRERNAFDQTIDDMITAIEEYKPYVTVHVVHETNVRTSSLLTVTTDEEAAFEAFKDTDNHVTMETINVSLDMIGDVFSEKTVDDISCDTLYNQVKDALREKDD